MDFNLTDEQQDLKDSIIRFARQELNASVREDERSNFFPRESWEKCAQMQIMALPFPEEYGGCGLDFLTTVICLASLGNACLDAGLVHAIGTQILCGIQINQFGTDEQKKKYLTGICSGELIAAQAITEPGSGSDAFAMRTRAKQDGDEFILSGNKVFITNGPIADLVNVFAITDPKAKSLGGISLFIVEKDQPGFERCKPIDKLGLRTLQNGELVLKNCRLKDNRLLGKKGQGAIIFNESMDWERILLPAVHLGTLERILETSIQYAKERKAFGQPISNYQAVSHKIAEMKVDLELGWLIVQRAATLKDTGKRASIDASIAKLFISESLKKACLNSLQIHGGYGFTTEYEIERDLRDSIAATIYSGTSEMQKNLISRLLGL